MLINRDTINFLTDQGLTDGSVKVVEPIESEGRWGISSPVDNGVSNGRATASSATSNSAAVQLQR
ncbi:hypothetical protein IHE45_18G014400 [Dioscorea alata]|uniref:Uncharacterized protein n=1 Tax=Dioscorea alata TaxID=55571 RepID=A0ACB7U588_DIOAL|nr:hypothetical protein IHE45_18G014400 [Dioscorea alata]